MRRFGMNMGLGRRGRGGAGSDPLVAEVPTTGHGNPNRPTFTETPLPNGETVRRVVRVVKEGGTLDVPANYTLEPGNAKVYHSWDSVASAEGYRIYDADNEPPVADDEGPSGTTEEATPLDLNSDAVFGPVGIVALGTGANTPFETAFGPVGTAAFGTGANTPEETVFGPITTLAELV